MSAEPDKDLLALLAEDDEAAPGGEALERAALVSFFDLDWLAERSGGSLAQKSAVLNASEPLDAKLDLWRLRASERVSQLKVLAGQPGLLDARLREATPMPGDAAGRALQALMGRSPIEGDDDEALEATFEAASWLREVDAIPSPDPRDIRRELSRRRRMRRMRETSQRFVGREEALTRLQQFADGPAPGWAGTPVLPVHGIGGIGKSALLARFLRDRVGPSDPQATTPLVFHLDFDRAGATASGPVDWMFEFNRQLALLLPGIAPVLDRQRKEAQAAHNARAKLGDGGLPASSSFVSEAAIQARDDAASGLLSLVSGFGLGRRTLLMVFDTVEALQVRSSNGLDQLGAWIATLRDKAGFSDIRVILSGRVPAALPDSGYGLFQAPDSVRLDELGRDHATALLERLGIGPAQAAPVVEAFGGNPLVLRLVAQLAARAGLDVADLAGSPEQRALADKELVQGILYERILKHVGDPAVRELAHPGLALRRVDWPVIQHVLAPICFGSEVGEAEAKRLYAALKGEVWLVDPAPDGGEGVVHRSDLRKLTMAIIRRDPGEARRFQTVYRAAIHHYEAGAGRLAAHAPDEVLYCRFMAGGALLPPLDEATARRAREAIGADRDDLPRPSSAALAAALDEGLALDDALGLPDELWARYVDKRGEELVQRDAYAEALELLERRPWPSAKHVPSWRLSALDALCRWDDMFDLLTEPSGSPQAGPNTASRLGTWLMAGLKSGRLGPRGELTVHLAGETIAALPKGGWTGSAEWVLLHSYAARAGVKRPHFQLSTADLLKSPELAFAWVRLLQATGQPAPFRPVRSQFYPSLPWLRSLRLDAGSMAGPALDELISELEGTERPRLVTGRLLGHFSGAFEALWTDAFVRSAIPEAAQRQLLAIRELPEFRPAARVAISEACDTPDRLALLAGQLAPLLPIVPSDLAEGQSRALSNGREFVANLVAYADRCQVLHPLLKLAREINPACERIGLVLRGMERWLTPL